MRFLSLIIFLASFLFATVASADVKTFTATHTYVLGDHDSKDDARQRCLIEAKRKILEQAGVYIESASEMKNFDLTKDTITSFSAAVMQVKKTKEEMRFQQGHMTMTLTLTATVDSGKVQKLQPVEPAGGVAAIQRRQMQQAPASSGSDISADEVKSLILDAALGDSKAQTDLGRLYASGGMNVAQDYEQARYWYAKAAAQGVQMAQYTLGVMYANGQGVAQDYGKARQWYEQAATSEPEVEWMFPGHEGAQYALGMMYTNGQGVPQDYVKARQWFEKAAAQGLAEAQNGLGGLYYNGLGVQRNPVKARQLWEQAAAQGVPKDYTKARPWFEKAAAQGNADAQVNLGMFYHLGWGVPQDYTLARQWYEKAAAQGDTEARYPLGVLYEKGLGVPHDDVRAYMWYSLAAEQSKDISQTHAADSRVEIARRMTPAQVAEAQRLSKRCYAQQFKGC